MELENSNHILRKYKKIYQKTSQVQCKGCSQAFEPLAFKGHVLNCRQLFTLDGDEIRNNSSSLSASVLDQQMTVKASQVDRTGFIKFLISYCGLSWYTQVQLEEVQFVIRSLQQNYPNLRSFTQKGSAQLKSFLALEVGSLNTAAGLELVNAFVQ